jgi:hypothetical protein
VGHSVHNLPLSVNIGVEDTQDVRELIGGNDQRLGLVSYLDRYMKLKIMLMLSSKDSFKATPRENKDTHHWTGGSRSSQRWFRPIFCPKS